MPQRQRQVGGGRHHTLDLRTRLLVYLFWVHSRPTQLMLCQMYGLSRGSIVSIISDMQISPSKLPTYATNNHLKDHGKIIHSILPWIHSPRLILQRDFRVLRDFKPRF